MYLFLVIQLSYIIAVMYSHLCNLWFSMSYAFNLLCLQLQILLFNVHILPVTRVFLGECHAVAFHLWSKLSKKPLNWLIFPGREPQLKHLPVVPAGAN